MKRKKLIGRGWLQATMVLHMAFISACASQRALHDGHFIPPGHFLSPLGSTWEYTTSTPSNDWFESLDKEKELTEGTYRGHSIQNSKNSGSTTTSDQVWFRKRFTVDEDDIENLIFWGRWSDNITVYVNGVEAVDHKGATNDYRYLGLTDKSRAVVNDKGYNTLVVAIDHADGVGSFDLAITTSREMTHLPETGMLKTDKLADISDTVKNYMQLHGIPAGVLAVRKGEELVISRGFGYMDKTFTQPIPPDAVMRLASNDKTITRDAIHHLLSSGRKDPVTQTEITLATPVFPLLRHVGILLSAEPNDPRVNDITIAHLLEHRGGLPPITRKDHRSLLRTAGKTDVNELDLHDNVSWLYRQKLEFEPGSQEQYSSTGPMVLRYLIYALTGDLQNYLREELFEPNGVSDIYIAHERLDDRVKTADGQYREPWYATLEAPYARWIYLENFTALAASAPAFAQYERHATGDLLTFGSMAGTWTAAAQISYGDLSFALFFNISGVYDDLAHELRARLLNRSPSDWGDVTVPVNYNTILPAVQIPSLR